MQDLHIEKTKSTPCVEYDADLRKLRISGQSYPENAFKFYEPVFAWLDEMLQAGAELNLEIFFYMPYINTSSSKCIMMLLERLEKAHQGGGSVSVHWQYSKDNETAFECAEEFKEDLTLPFDLIAVEDEK